MRARIIKLTGDEAIIVVEEAKPPLVNALRRAIISEVPVFAVDEVIFFENSTPFFDEYIAHRLAMVPLRTSMDIVRSDPERTVVLELNKEAKEDLETIYSGDLKSTDPLIVPANDRIPVIKMRKGQKIRLQAVARVGRGKDHSKWQPAVAVGYSYMPVYELSRDLLKKCDLSSCGDCMKRKGKKVIIDCPVSCEGCLESLERCRLDNPEGITSKWDDSRIILRYESSGSLPAQEIFLEALNQLKRKFIEFSEKLR